MGERVEPRLPELPVMLEPQRRVLERSGIEAAAHRAPRLLAMHEARALQHGEMLQDAR